MNKEALDYGFKAFPDRDAAVDLISQGHNFDSELALNSMTNTDYDYGFSYKDRKALKKLDRLGLSDAIKSSNGFIEEVDGYTRKPDILATPEGAIKASQFIRSEILPKYDNLDEQMDSAIQQEVEYTNRINDAKQEHEIKQNVLSNQVNDSNLNYQVTRNSDFLNRAKGRLSQVNSKIGEGRMMLNEALFRRKIDAYKKKISDVPDSVMYARFADAIDKSLADGNRLYDFRYY